MDTKICTRCGQAKELACFHFYKYKGEKKRKAHCKDCQRSLHSEWLSKNREYAREKRREYVDKNKDEISEKRKKHYLENRDKILEKDRQRYNENRKEILSRRKDQYYSDHENSKKKATEYYKKNIERRRELSRKYISTPEAREKNRVLAEKRRESDPDCFKRYYEKNKERYREHDARRRLIVRGASINLTQEQIQQMRDMYWLAKDLSAVSGEQYEVDHIIPIRGKDICGLHVPWNLQVLPRDLNRRKSASYNPEDVIAS